jgi:uncharacterized protein (DUF1499 family)
LTPLAWLASLAFPACGAVGAAGLPVPTLMDMTAIQRPGTPNTFLAGPEGMKPEPDLVTREHSLPATEMYENARMLFERQPRTYVAAEFPQQLQVHYVVRSALLNFPDLVTVQTNAAGPAGSTVTIWSRSVYGRGDLGVNRKRTEAWIAALQQSNQR